MARIPERPALVLVVARSGTVAHDLRRFLAAGAFEVRSALPAEPAGAGAAESVGEKPHVVVFDLSQRLDLRGDLVDVPTLAIVRRGSTDDLTAALDAGALDVLPLPFIAAEVQGRVATAARVASAEARLATRNAELAAWAERAGHDLMTPLAVISGMAETLDAAWDRLGEADRARLLASIRNQAGKAMAMLDEGVAVARQGAGRSESSPPAAAGP